MNNGVLVFWPIIAALERRVSAIRNDILATVLDVAGACKIHIFPSEFDRQKGAFEFISVHVLSNFVSSVVERL